MAKALIGLHIILCPEISHPSSRLKAACISIHWRWMVFYIDTRTGGQGGAGLGVTDWEEKYAFIISFRQMPLTTILIFQIMQPASRRRYESFYHFYVLPLLCQKTPLLSLLIIMGENQFDNIEKP